MRAFVVVGCIACFLSSASVQADEEELVISDSAVVGLSSAAIDEVLQLPEITDFRVPDSLNFAPADLDEHARTAKAAHASLPLSEVRPSEIYDIIIQAGHYGRTSGATGGQGSYVSEQEIAAWVAGMVAEKLATHGVRVALISADDFPRPMTSRLFLAFHTDAAAFQCAVGPSIGYGNPEDSLGMQLVAVALAISLGIDPEDFMRDSYTKNLSSYYAFRHMDTTDFEGVLEMSELTCPSQEENLLGNARVLADNLSTAIRFALRAPPR